MSGNKLNSMLSLPVGNGIHAGKSNLAEYCSTQNLSTTA